jgi:predicted ATPase
LHLLLVAATIGVEFSLEMLNALDDASEHRAELEGLCAAGLIYLANVPGAYRFHHGITREAVYESVSIAERLRLHRPIAAKIEREAQASTLVDRSEALAYHYRSSADFERAATYAERAGDKAMASYSLDRACFRYATAL